MFKPLIYAGSNIIEDEPPAIKEESIGVLDFLKKPDNGSLKIKNEDPLPPGNPERPKRGRPKGSTKTKTLSNGDTMVVGDEDDDELPKFQTNDPYINSYKDTNAMLKTSIMQIDILNNDIKGELDNIKSSKTMKGKYTYISELTGTSSNLLNTKISAIREINKTITDSHNLEMKRIKELKTVDDGNDDKRIMDMYNAFISTPIGNYNPLGPSIMDISMPSQNINMVRTDIMGNTDDIGYASYVNNMTPEQNRMRLETNPNIKTVVMYNQETGARWFDTIDVTTGQSVPNMPKPGEFILEDLNINVRAGTARNSNIDADYPLIVVGQNNSIMDF